MEDVSCKIYTFFWGALGAGPWGAAQCASRKILFG